MAKKMSALAAVRHAARAAGLVEIHDSGPCRDGRLAIYGNAEAAEDYVHGKGVLGHWVEARFDWFGLEAVVEYVDNAVVARAGAADALDMIGRIALEGKC